MIWRVCRLTLILHIADLILTQGAVSAACSISHRLLVEREALSPIDVAIPQPVPATKKTQKVGSVSKSETLTSEHISVVVPSQGWWLYVIKLACYDWIASVGCCSFMKENLETWNVFFLFRCVHNLLQSLEVICFSPQVVVNGKKWTWILQRKSSESCEVVRLCLLLVLKWMEAIHRIVEWPGGWK